MKKLLTIVALSALVIGAPTASFAAAKPKPAAPAATPAPAPAATPAVAKNIPMHSQVTTLDVAGKSFTHKNADGKEVKFVLTDKTEIKQGKADAKFEDIKVGDWVSGLRLKKSDTEWEVVKITKFGALEKSDKKGADKTKPAADKKPN
ncbi:MAG TPA: hypothetical protein VK961_25885 [Chthoniobacter sp.]|nr:hypothetical protein [Chthoniobacter sp.]